MLEKCDAHKEVVGNIKELFTRVTALERFQSSSEQYNRNIDRRFDELESKTDKIIVTTENIQAEMKKRNDQIVEKIIAALIGAGMTIIIAKLTGL
jgi:hypothetical protein